MLYTWGNNTKGQCGVDKTTESFRIPAQVEEMNSLPVRLVHIATGNSHLICISDTGDIYSCGESDKQQREDCSSGLFAHVG